MGLQDLPRTCKRKIVLTIHISSPAGDKRDHSNTRVTLTGSDHPAAPLQQNVPDTSRKKMCKKTQTNPTTEQLLNEW